MVVWPEEFDSDETIIRIDNNVTEIGGLSINQIREAIFSLQSELGLNPAGSAGSLANFLDVSFNSNGTLKASALTSVGLASLPIVDNQVASNAAIKESKLALDFSTSDLHTLIVANSGLLTTLSAFSTTINADLLIHTQGGSLFSDGSTLARHVASHIDLNTVTSDSRDPSYTWTGLKDKTGSLRSATHVAEALLQVNDDLVSHENATADAHVASAISVDTSSFVELSEDADTVQKALEEIDAGETLIIGLHRATQHSNGIPKTARSMSLVLPDGYSQEVVPPTPAEAFLVRSPATTPQDNNTTGDDLVVFSPLSNSGFVFDAQFSQVKSGDVLRINYGNGLEAAFLVDSIRHAPGSEWVVRLNGNNISDTDGYDGYARIDRPLFDTNVSGVLALASANNDIDNSIMASLIAGHPRGAAALGIGFDPNKLNSTHYKLYLQLYPTGNPADRVVDLPFIDVTGNAGVTPGQYTLDSIIAETNDALRAAGYNFRFVVYSHRGEFGIMLADPVGNASFSIVSGILSGTSLVVGTYSENVVGDALDGADAFGFGINGINIASPVYNASFGSATAALTPTKIITPFKRRNYIVNGVRRDDFAATSNTFGDGYWPAQITNRQLIGVTTVETTYRVELDLCDAELKVGKTIVVQPVVAFNTSSYTDADYGRFIIKEVLFSPACGDASAYTIIKVINGVHAAGNPVGFSSSPPLQVKLYFSEDSISFNALNVIDSSASLTYNRFHEIYVTEHGKTFSHERARIIRQSETSELLGTTNRWNIRYVSPKLRGFKDDSSSALNKYVRFFVLNYDSSTGEYEGFIGKRDPLSANITNTGVITRAKKNQSARFYDETNLDYIELEFFDETASPGTNILSTNSSRYVDIEIFQSLATDDEVMLIGTCELEENRVHAVRSDLRQFGSISEKDFTNSAIDYIEAGDKYLHANGIITGLDFVSASASNPRILSFTGGLALVDGRIATVNNGSVEIPEISNSSSGLPQTLDWAICVNKEGQFEAILLTSVKTQFFATTGGTSFLVPSATFTDLILSRKDLTLIHIANVTISSFALNSVTDARKYVLSETLNSPLTLVPSGNGGPIGHFKSFDAVKTWTNLYGNLNNTVKVRGAVSVSSSLDLSGLIYPLTLEGENGSFTITANKGFIVGSNITFKNLTFNYTPTIITPGTDLILRQNGGCVFGPKDSTIVDLQDVVVDNCVFNCTIAGYRPPFVNFNTFKNRSLDGIVVRNCKFNDDVSSGPCAAIAVINENTGSGSVAAIIANSVFEDNICNREQGVYITSVGIGSPIIFAVPGLNSVNTSIRKNVAGSIGYTISSFDNRKASRGTLPSIGLIIEENTAKLIYSCDHKGLKYASSTTSGTAYGSGNVVIRNNFSSWISATVASSDSIALGHGTVVIEGNNLDGYNATYLTNRGFSTGASNAINIEAGLQIESTEQGSRPAARIVNNYINNGQFAQLTNNYDIGIVSNSSFIVSNNDISGFEDYGIFTRAPHGIIQGNRLRRIGSITNYIFIGPPTAASSSTGICTDNFLDDSTVDGSSTSVINATGTTTNWIVERNKNQTVVYTIESYRGTAAYSGFVAGTNSLAPNSVIQGYDQPIGGTEQVVEATYSNPDAYVAFQWTVPLHGVLPDNVNVLSVSTSYESSVAIANVPGTGNGEGVLALRQGVNTNSTALNIKSGSYTAGTTTPITLTPTNSFRTNRSGNQELVTYVTMVLDHTSLVSFLVFPLAITYRW